MSVSPAFLPHDPFLPHYPFRRLMRYRPIWIAPLALLSLVGFGSLARGGEDAAGGDDALRWDFESGPSGELVGDASIAPVGPTSTYFAGMPETNHALTLDGRGSHVRVGDEADDGSLKFGLGDSITIEAWVRSDAVASGRNVYVVGKGRTYRGESRENQNYALRLRGVSGEARLSFLFRSEANDDEPSEYHRWTSKVGFRPDGDWHHVAVSYTFGEPKSLQGYLDGEPVGGSWDMGGATERPPVVDDDELWIGSSMGGNPSSSFRGAIDGVVIERRIVPADVFASRRQPIVRPPQPPASGLPGDAVLVTLLEGCGDASWPIAVAEPDRTWQQPAVALATIPTPYARGGVRRDWDGAVMVTAMVEIDLPGEPLEWMLRAGGLSRLWVGDEVIAETPPHLRNANAHHEVDPVTQADPWLRPLHAGHRERIFEHRSAEGRTHVTLQTMVGGQGLRHEVGEVLVAVRTEGDPEWRLLGHGDFVPVTDDGWQTYAAAQRAIVDTVDRVERRRAAAEDDPYWDRRHEAARRHVASLPPIDLPETANRSDTHPIDVFVAASLEGTGMSPTPRVDDVRFLRRVFLDCVGVPPTETEVAWFRQLSGDRDSRRDAVIDRLLDDPRWADHWTAYWLDVLAENPSILKPTLNNTGPFRYYIHDVMRDHVPVDRWVTDLVRMEGSVLGGGPAGFGMATQNDVPMAAKAHVLGTAFLGANMKCARCHDAPYHDWTQQDLFSLAAMLERKPIRVPESSSVPAAFFEESVGADLITLTLSPGDEVEPEWSLAGITSDAPLERWMLDRDDSPRERFAALLTRPENGQFARVVVNRLWARLIGEGLVEPLDDWDFARASHPELMEVLARELIGSGYDFRHVARTILRSRLYQQQSVDRAVTTREDARHFDAPRRRRMTAEQVVDSMHTAIGRAMDVGDLTFDPEARQRPNVFLNLGAPRRAWQLTSLSNERDRPSLSLPKAAAVTDCLEAFGWSGSRQEPVNDRHDDPNVIQPGLLAGGVLSIQLTRLTDGDALTEICLEAESPESLVDTLFERFLTRGPTSDEEALFVGLLADGFDTRVMETPIAAETPIREPAVTWANHLSSEANRIRMRQNRRLLEGPEPTGRLAPGWRERAEDAVWALINTPEFQYLP